MKNGNGTRKVTVQRTRVSKPWEQAFLSALEETGVISRAAEAAEISRKTVYNEKRDNPDFAKAFDESLQAGALLLEAEAIRRARDGVVRMKFNSKTGLPFIDPRTDQPYMEHEYSDTLMLALLKRHYPEQYREQKQDVNVTTTNVTNVYFSTEQQRNVQERIAANRGFALNGKN